VAAAKKTLLSDPDARTEELNASDLAELEKWSAQYPTNPGHPAGSRPTTTGFHTFDSSGESLTDVDLRTPTIPPASVVKFEAGLRVCPYCQKPIHLSATNCRECGTPVPRQ
jgi:hypothetical protein